MVRHHKSGCYFNPILEPHPSMIMLGVRPVFLSLAEPDPLLPFTRYAEEERVWHTPIELAVLVSTGSRWSKLNQTQ